MIQETIPRSVYFLVKYNRTEGCFTAFCTGTRVETISDAHLCQIIRYYPSPSVNLTSWFCLFQRLARQHVQRRRWLRHPLRVRYRELNGRFPPYPRHLLPAFAPREES